MTQNIASSVAPPRNTLPILPLLHKLKDAYLLWFSYYQIIPKTHRHTLALRIDDLFVEAIEAVATASFLGVTEKLPFIKLAMRKIDTIKIMLMVLWETGTLENKKYIAISDKVNNIGKMIGGWNGQISKSLEDLGKTQPPKPKA